MYGQSHDLCCSHSLSFGIFLQKQFHLPVTLSVLAKDKVRAYCIMKFPFYDLKSYFPSMSLLWRTVLEIPSAPYGAEEMGNFDFCIYGQTTVRVNLCFELHFLA